MALARSLGDGRHDVTQWISAFVTRGDTYLLSHAGPANLYATATEFDSVNGTITNGREGHFDVDIPLFSTRPFVHRGVLIGDHTEATVQECKANATGALESLVIAPGPGFPKTVLQAWARYGTMFYNLKLDGSNWVRDGQGMAESAFFTDETFTRFNASGYADRIYFGQKEPTENRDLIWMENAGKIMIARALGTVEGLPNIITAPALPPDQIELFLYAPLPDGFRVQDSRFPDQQGRVLYMQDLIKP